MPRVKQDALAPANDDTTVPGIASRLGIQVVEDWYLHMMLTGCGFQVRAGTITTPLVGDVVITDTAAEMCTDVTSGLTLIPVYLNMGIRLATGTLHEYAAKSVGTVSSAGTAFVALPLKTGTRTGGTPAAAQSTSRVSAAGGVTVTAEAVTTTRRHWAYSNPISNTTAGATAGPINGAVPDWVPRVPPILVGPYCFYVQIAATGTGPSYYANYDFFEVATASLL